MTLSELKSHLSTLGSITFELPNGKPVPKHFHVTEIGAINKRFIDCGGTLRNENVVSLQLWSSIDFHHRLKAEKLLNIIALSESKLGLSDEQVEVEYQGETIGKYGLDFDGTAFLLTSKQTDCLAKDNCGIDTVKEKLSLASLSSESCCTPGGGCC